MAVPEIAERAGVRSLRLKRDDLYPALNGGTKVRKLDLLLASEPFQGAGAWVVAGAVGSGQVVATVAAGRLVGKPVHAHLFRTPLGAHGLENLAYSASWAASVHGYRNQVDLALRAPRVVLGLHSGGRAVVPIGATSARGMLGCVLGGIELASQLASSPDPVPDAVYVACGSGGTAAGLAVGLALAGVEVPVRAVAVVDRLFAPDMRLSYLVGQAEKAVRSLGLTPGVARLEVHRGQVGRGYAHASVASLAGAQTLLDAGVAGEPAYTGKAFAALVADAHAGRTRDPIFWVTVRRPGLESTEGWRERLPLSLRDLATTGDQPVVIRRRGLLLGLAAAAALVGTFRLTGYDGAGGEVLSAAEAAVVRAAGEALLPAATPADLDALAGRVDRYLLTFPTSLRQEVHALFFAVEQVLPFWVGMQRFTVLTPPERLRALERVAALGGPGLLIARSIRDLVLVAWYQSPEAWADVGYEGPMVGSLPRPSLYDELKAPQGWEPFGAGP